jgi:hypothetical protein
VTQLRKKLLEELQCRIWPGIRRSGCGQSRGAEHGEVVRISSSSRRLDEAIAVRANDIGHLEEWSGH